MDTAQINRYLANALAMCQAGRFAEAQAIYDRLMREAPERIEPWLNSAEIARIEGRFEDAARHYERTLARQPDLPQALAGLGQSYLALDRAAEALTLFERLGARVPRSDMAARGAGEALSQLGRMTEARAALEKAVALAPDAAGHHYALAQTGRFVPDDPRLAGLVRLEAKISTLPPPAQCDLQFALGKACDELGRYEQAFAHWQAGNAIRRRFIDYDERLYLGILRDLAAAFPAGVLAARAGTGAPSPCPVFVVGMPRSGTTLVEQILASHPDVCGAGESMQLHRLVGSGLLGPDFPHDFARVPDRNLQELGSRYLAHMQARAPDAKRIVDKLTANFMLCGLIRLALPGAHIVHVRRDPLDTCLSCYSNTFSQDFDYAYDLSELGRYYRAYEDLMAHWRAVLPEDAMIDVRYETLVDDFETETRRILDFCGLDWHPACLEFHKTARTVHTLSTAQVRQPLYRSSVGRAGHYAPWLAPLRAALEAKGTA